jgi:hypothetical protein
LGCIKDTPIIEGQTEEGPGRQEKISTGALAFSQGIEGGVGGTPFTIISKGAQNRDGSAPLFPFLKCPTLRRRRSAIATMKLGLG